MTRRCSHCSNNGHNSRTCPTRASVRLFGVSLTANKGGAMKKSASMGCLYSSSVSASPGNGAAFGDESPGRDRGGDGGGEGYASDDPNRASCSPNCRGERKKGTPWTEEEHRMFLVGLQKLGKGDWRGIARNYVVSRTPTQVASHAQKYFIRQSNATRRKRRSSLFDMVPDKVDQAPVLEEQFPHQSPPAEPENTIKLSDLDLSADQGISTTKSIVDESITEAEEEILVPCIDFPQIMPTFYPTYIPVPYPFWPSSGSVLMEETPTMEKHEILKPTPVLPKEPTHIDELVRMSKLSLTEANPSRIEPSALSTKLLAPSSSRQSAFHLNPAAASSDLNQSSGNAIHAV